MRELIDAMTDENPVKRPTIEEVIEKFDEIRSSLSTVKLRSPIISKKDPTIFTIYRHARQLTRTVLYVIQRMPAVPVSIT
jgi:hypothetical protein